MTTTETEAARLRRQLDWANWSAAYWELTARTKASRVWAYTWNPLHWRVFMGSDERDRRTLVVGPLVVALWLCRCADCREDRARLEATVDDEPEW